MATPEEIAALRLLIAEPNTDTYSDDDLNDRLTAGVNEYAVAQDIWTEKAAAAAALVDISEGGSSRKMGDIYEQALSMASEMGARSTIAASPSSVGTRIRKLTRP